MLLSEAVDALAVATIADGRSQRTAQDYRDKLSVLVAFLADPPIDQVTVGDLRRFIADLRTRQTRYADTGARPEIPGGLSLASVAGYVRCVKRLFSWLLDEQLIAANPAKRIKTPTVPRGEPKAYDRNDFTKLLAATAGDDPVAIRDRAVLLFLADTGCRLAGLVGLAIDDVDLERMIAKVLEKGGRTRRVVFSEPTRDALAAWLAVRPRVDHTMLWANLGHRGSPWLTDEGVRQILKRLKAKAGVTGPVNPHAFRHGFAREYLLNGGDLGTLADLLGHSDVQVTWQHYAIFRTAELQAKHDKHSPVAILGRKGEL